MPIKIPKGFQRRKSSGNVLDEGHASEPSFKVYARPQSGHKSLDINLAQQKPLPLRKNSYEQEDEDLFTVRRPDAANRYVSPFQRTGTRPDIASGSGGTANSLSTAPYDSAASSTRLSSSSTVPSSIDARSDKNVLPTTQAFPSEPPPPPAHQSKTGAFIRNASRTFSLGGKSKPSDTPEPPVPPMPVNRAQFSNLDGRDRSMTTSSISTATPPRLLESDLSISTSEFDGFGNMFDGIGAKSRDQSPVRAVAVESANGNRLRPDAVTAGRSAPPRPINVDRTIQVESSPYSWASEHSGNPLMHTPGSVDTVLHKSPPLTTGKTFGKPIREPLSLPSLEPAMDDNMFADTPSRPRAYSRPGQSTGPFSPQTGQTTSSHSSAGITGTSLQTSPILERDIEAFDPSLLASAQLATQYQDLKPPPLATSTISSKKVMTPAEFERYKRQKDETHRLNKVFRNTRPESDESDDNYDDLEEDDETERDRQIAKQRRKQEAHLAVYRQTMIKVTGESSIPNARSNNSINILPPASQSATDLANQYSNISFDRSPARSSDDDEDDDIPLGILAAHGFPNKNKPPNRLANSSSNPNLRASVQQQQAPASVAGESTNRGSLPVFARHLPEDPYYGASLVNQVNRESMAMNSSNLMPSGAATAHPHHPSGLVGVIAGEERARAMRRGSPSAATGAFDLPSSVPGHPGMLRSQTTGSIPNMMMPPNMPGMLSPGDQAQIQMSQQMTQMMQMQMQWMQQMQQMMASQGPNANMPQAMPNFPVVNNVPRPQSVPLQNHAPTEPRAMSMLGAPSMFGWSNGPPTLQNAPGSSYAPSIAPSERSNIGLAPRYRPVSTVQQPEQPWTKRTSTMTSTTVRPWSQFGGGGKQPSSTIRKVAAPAEDEDDEQGWAEMKAKKDQKKKTWKLRKGPNVLQELYNGS